MTSTPAITAISTAAPTASVAGLSDLREPLR